MAAGEYFIKKKTVIQDLKYRLMRFGTSKTLLMITSCVQMRLLVNTK